MTPVGPGSSPAQSRSHVSVLRVAAIVYSVVVAIAFAFFVWALFDEPFQGGPGPTMAGIWPMLATLPTSYLTWGLVSWFAGTVDLNDTVASRLIITLVLGIATAVAAGINMLLVRFAARLIRRASTAAPVRR